MQITAAMVKEIRDITGAGMSACKNALTEAGGDIKKATELLREKGLAAAAKKAGRVAAEGLVAASLSTDRKSGAIVEVNSETDFVAKNEDFITFVQQVADQALASSAANVDELLAEAWLPNPGQTVKDVLNGKVAIIGENIGIRRFEKFNAGENSAVVHYIHHGGRVGAMVEVSAPAVNDEIIEAGRNVCMHISMMAPQFLSMDLIPAEQMKAETDFQTSTALKENEEAEKPKPAQIIENMVKGRVAKHFKALCLLEQEYVKDGQFTVDGYMKSVNKDAKIVRYARFERGEGVEKKEENFADEVAKAMQG